MTAAGRGGGRELPRLRALKRVSGRRRVLTEVLPVPYHLQTAVHQPEPAFRGGELDALRLVHLGGRDMERPHGPRGPLDDGLHGVLGLDRMHACAGPPEDRRRRPGEVEQQVQVVLPLVQKHTAALATPGPAPGSQAEVGVAARPRPQQRRVLEVSQHTLLDQTPGLADLGAGSLLERDREHPALALGRSHHLVRLRHLDRDRLLDQDVEPGLEARQGETGMGGVWGRDDGKVRRPLEKLRRVLIGGTVQLRGDPPHPLPVDVLHAHHLSPDRFQPAAVRGEDLRPRAGHHDPKRAHRTDPSESPSRRRRYVKR